MFSLAQQPAAFEQVAPLIFYGFAFLTVLSAWAAVLSQNIVRMAIYLLFTLAGVAGLYFMLNAELLAAIQLIVYAGGTLILIVFGVMLTSKNPFMQLRVKGWERVLGSLIGLALAALVFFALVRSELPQPQPAGESTYDQVLLVGKALLSSYLVPFEVAGVLLLVVMIGAAYMARRRLD